MTRRTPPRDEPAPDAFVGYAIVRVASALERAFTRALAPEGITARQFSVLVHLAREPGISSGRLARLVLITPQSMSTLVASLEARGWLERAPDPGPGLPMGVRLTRRGLAKLAKARERAWAANAAAMTGLSEAEAAALDGLLLRVLAAVE